MVLEVILVNKILIRMRKVFYDSGKSQTEIGKMIGKTSQYVWKLLNNDDSKPSESVIRDVCRVFGISYLWLTEGIEPMKESLDVDSMARIDDIMTGENEFAKNLFREFAKLDDSEWQMLEKLIKNLAEEKE